MSRLFSRLILAFLVVAVFVGITGAAQTTYAGSPPRKPCVPRPVTSEVVVPAVPVPCGPNDDESSPACRAEMRKTVKPVAWPATALEALPLAEDEARKWRQDAVLLEVDAVLLASEWEQIGLDGRANRWYFIFGDKGVFGAVSQGYEVARTRQETTGKTINLRTSHQQALQGGGIYPATDSSSFLSLAASQYGLADWLKAKPGRTIYRLHYWDSGYQPGWQVQVMESDETVGYNLIFHGQEAWIWQMDGVTRMDKTPPPPPSDFQTTGIYYAGSDHGQYTFTRSWRQSNGLGQTVWSQELANLALELLKQAVASGQPPTLPSGMSGISGIEGAVHGGGQNSTTAGYDGLIGGAGDIKMGIATYQRPGGIMTVEIVSR